MDDGLELLTGPPELEEYLRLRAASGLSPKRPDQGDAVLTGSWSFCHVRDVASGEAVAMGRTIGDGGWYFHLADIATDPRFQRRGLGRRVVGWLLDDIVARAPHDAYVTLLADAPGRRLYESLGFVPSAPASVGMVWRPEI
ncbi:GNAT family N-acetyltransferase [Aeromicrobium piscarium]|uniref:GNAT family N-acetyltransferase n=1 Tax=Aeromicrobium piscarium TaxID=2590901 RepID=A0A554SDE4_9ACTN|nr:GNAT family N-acetyltransferase [Aeromicrobium piscarium]TSD64355.1 GNAT family N-acetyltransferase [Aeromicrobium piscarium]